MSVLDVLLLLIITRESVTGDTADIPRSENNASDCDLALG